MEGLTHTEGMRDKRQILAEAGRRGGSAKVPKGAATFDPETRAKLAQHAALARWGNQDLKNSEEFRKKKAEISRNWRAKKKSENLLASTDSLTA